MPLSHHKAACLLCYPSIKTTAVLPFTEAYSAWHVSELFVCMNLFQQCNEVDTNSPDPTDEEMEARKMK